MTDTSILWQPPNVDSRIWWGWFAGALGCDPNLDRPFLICIRGVAVNAAESHPLVAVPAYADAGVLLYRGGETLFGMSSIPMQTHSTASPDVDGDGQGDVACIKAGRYVLRDLGADAGPYPIFAVSNPDGTTKLPCSRDLKHDGLIDHEGPAIYTADEILLHTGIDGLKLNPPSPHTYSIGCSTTSLPNLQLLRARTQVTGSGRADYLIITADDAVATMKRSPYLPSAPESVA